MKQLTIDIFPYSHSHSHISKKEPQSISPLSPQNVYTYTTLIPNLNQRMNTSSLGLKSHQTNQTNSEDPKNSFIHSFCSLLVLLPPGSILEEEEKKHLIIRQAGQVKMSVPLRLPTPDVAS